MTTTQSKYWCFTLNNYTAHEVIQLQHFIANHCSYGVYGKEVGDSGTPHLQGYVELKGRKRMRTVKTLMNNNRVALFKRRGSAKQASDYCKKDDDDFFEVGDISEPEPGKRNDIHRVRDAISAGEITNVFDLLMSVSSTGSLAIGSRILHASGAAKHRTPPTVFWLWGATGTFKTKSVYDFRDRTDLPFWKSGINGIKWFDGYVGQDIALFDDYRWDGKRSSYKQLLLLTDRYMAGVEFKGGSTWFSSKFIFITCPEEPEVHFRDLPLADPIDQLLRRINERGGIFNFNLQAERERFNERIEQYMVVVPESDEDE